jgi:hypothetical protein
MYNKVIKNSILCYCVEANHKCFTIADIQKNIEKWTIFDVPLSDVTGHLRGLATRYPDVCYGLRGIFPCLS